MKKYILETLDAYVQKHGMESVAGDYPIRVAQADVAFVLGYGGRNEWEPLIREKPKDENLLVLWYLQELMGQYNGSASASIPHTIELCKSLVSEYLIDAEVSYDELKASLISATPEEYEKLHAICQTNDWIKTGGIDFGDWELMNEDDYPFAFPRLTTPRLLRAFFGDYGWAIRQGVQYHDLVFVQQVNGGDEYWTLKRFDGVYLPFESMSMQYIVKEGSFFSKLRRLEAATMEQCRTLTY